MKPSYEFQLKLFKVFKRLGTPGYKWGDAYICIFKVRANNNSSVQIDKKGGEPVPSVVVFSNITCRHTVRIANSLRIISLKMFL